VAEFEVESYMVATQQSGPDLARAARRITLTSPALTHGIRPSASIFFSDIPRTRLGFVVNVDQLNFQGHRVLARLAKDDFADWYDILRNEQPLRFLYRYDGEGSIDPSQSRRELFRVRLYTGLPEPPGEGEDDVLQALLLKEDAPELRRAAESEAADGGGT
jgi:hypothetical protein